MKKTISIIVVTVVFLACSPYTFLSNKQKKELKEDYASRVDGFKTIASYLKLTNNDTICDIASGQGISISILSNFLPPNTQYIVEDINPKFCSRNFFKTTFKFLKSNTNINNYHFFIGQKNKLPFKSNSFNHITLFISLHEFEYKQTMLSEIYRVLKSNGKLYLVETVSTDSTTHKDPYCGFIYLKNNEINSLLTQTNFKPVVDTIPNTIKDSSQPYVRFLILSK